MIKNLSLISMLGVTLFAGLTLTACESGPFSPKAKAQEVGQAAARWSKLQRAYNMETNSVGDAAKIKYTPPGASGPSNYGETKNFIYKTSAQEDMAVWSARNKKNLDKCHAGSEWQIIAKINAKKELVIEATPPKKAKCIELTPNFSNVQ